MLFYFLENDLAINAITAITATTIMTPSQIPVLNTSPINSQPENIKAEKRILMIDIRIFIKFYFIVLSFILFLDSASLIG